MTAIRDHAMTDQPTRTETIKRLLEEVDLYLDSLDVDQRDCVNQLSVLACKIDDANGTIMELEQQQDVIRDYLDAMIDHAQHLAETVQSLGYHALPDEDEDEDDEEQPAA